MALFVSVRPVVCLIALAVLPAGVVRVAAQAVPPRPLGAELPAWRAAGDEREMRIENPTGQVTLREALALALMHSPDLAAFAWETRAREARLLQAGLLPNPVFSVQAEDLGRSTDAASGRGLLQPQATIQLSQLIELGGKRAARQRLAQSHQQLAEWDFEAARLDVLTRVSQAFVGVLANQQTLALAEEAMRLGDEMRQIVATRVEAGVVSPIEQTRAEVALATLRIDVERARRALDAERLRLALLWGGSNAQFAAAVGELTTPAMLPPLSALMERLAANPDLERWVAETSQRQAALALERSRRTPEVTVHAGYRRFTTIDTNALLIGASIPLPFFDRNQGAIREAADRVGKAGEEQRAAEARVRAALGESYRALATAHDEAEAISVQLLPGARATFDAVSEGYRLGRFAYLDVLDAQRTLLTANSQYLRALSDYHHAIVDVERLIGMPLSMVPATGSAVVK